SGIHALRQRLEIRTAPGEKHADEFLRHRKNLAQLPERSKFGSRVLDTGSLTRHRSSQTSPRRISMPRFRSLALCLAALFAMLITAACAEQTAQKPAAPPDTRKADEAAIRAASSDWSKASLAKDLDKATSYYTDDAIFFVNNGARVKGKDAIKMAW